MKLHSITHLCGMPSASQPQQQQQGYCSDAPIVHKIEEHLQTNKLQAGALMKGAEE